MLILVISLLVANRDIGTGVDTYSYLLNFERIVACDCLSLEFFEPGFQGLTWISAKVGLTSSQYFLVLSALFNVTLFSFIKIYGQSFGNAVAARAPFYLYISAIFVFSSNFYLTALINGIRQGMAAPFIFLGAMFFLQRRWLWFGLVLIVAISLHKSSIMYFSFFPLLIFKARTSAITLVVAAFFYWTGLSETIVHEASRLTNVPIYTMIVEYSDTGLYEGFNIFFFLYSLLPLAVMAIGRGVTGRVLESGFSTISFRIYSVLILPYLFFGFSGYANRYAFTAWLFLPVFLGSFVYSMFKKDEILFLVSYLTVHISILYFIIKFQSFS
jgi:hypothetical protein